jgi:tRNA pseudouridine38-40 synthase
LPRYKLIIEYDGTPFSGWQAQKKHLGVQNVIMQAVQAFCGEDVKLGGAGRTDTGVHAAGQVAHIDLTKNWAPARVRDALNAHIRDYPVSILEVEKVDETFDARFSAKGRLYRYRILNRRSSPTLDLYRVWHVIAPLDEKLMQEGAAYLIGKHDFTTFRHARCQSKSPVKNLDRLDVRRKGDEIFIEAESKSFLHNQVRSIVGSLKLVGEGKHKPAWIKKILEARDRKLCGALAPACGLTLMRVNY